MVSLGIPDLSTTFLIAALVPLILGFIVGLIVKSVLKIGIALALLVIVLILLGVVTPGQVLTPLLGLVKSGSSLTNEVSRVASYLPYSSITFIIGLVIGFWRG